MLMVTHPEFATKNRAAITPMPIIDRMAVAVAAYRSHRITSARYYGQRLLVPGGPLPLIARRRRIDRVADDATYEPRADELAIRHAHEVAVPTHGAEVVGRAEAQREHG